jgi:hypothetical protein
VVRVQAAVLTANAVRVAKAVSVAVLVKTAARVAKVALAARVRAVSAANAVRVAPAVARDKAARPSLTAIPAMRRTSHPITPVPAASTRMATSHAARALADARAALVLRAAVPVAHRVDIVPVATAGLLARAPAARVRVVLVPVARVVADARAADAIPAADRCCYRYVSNEEGRHRRPSSLQHSIAFPFSACDHASRTHRMREKRSASPLVTLDAFRHGPAQSRGTSSYLLAPANILFRAFNGGALRCTDVIS